jgi:hypothetical protein
MKKSSSSGFFHCPKSFNRWLVVVGVGDVVALTASVQSSATLDSPGCDDANLLANDDNVCARVGIDDAVIVVDVKSDESEVPSGVRLRQTFDQIA